MPPFDQSAKVRPNPCFDSIREAKTIADVQAVWPLVRVLRPHLSSAELLTAAWESQLDEGYRLAVVYADGVPAGIAGFRLAHTLAWGRHLYVDDLVVKESARRGGLGRLLLQYIEHEARALGCAEIHLDTGHTRHDAHRLYLRVGFHLTCHHLSKNIASSASGGQ